MDPLINACKLRITFGTEKEEEEPEVIEFVSDSDDVPSMNPGGGGWKIKDLRDVKIPEMESLTFHSDRFIHEEAIVYLNLARIFDLNNNSYFTNSYAALEVLKYLYPDSISVVFGPKTLTADETKLKNEDLKNLNVLRGWEWDGDISNERNIGSIITEIMSTIYSINVMIFTLSDPNNEYKSIQELLGQCRIIIHTLTIGGVAIIKLPHGKVTSLLYQILYTLFLNFTNSYVINPITSKDWFFVGTKKLEETFNPFDDVEYMNNLDFPPLNSIDVMEDGLIDNVPLPFVDYFTKVISMKKELKDCRTDKLQRYLS